RYQDAASRRMDWERKRIQLGMSPAEGYHEDVTVVGELVDQSEAVEPRPERISTRVSVIIEWENAIRADSKNLPLLFTNLRQEIENFGERIELIILHDPGVVDSGRLCNLLAQSELDQSDGIDLNVYELSGRHYYDLKNEGVLRSRGEIVVFVDSDVEPKNGWLSNLVGYLDENSDVGMVGGFTYIKPSGVVSKAFSAGWFFPLQPASAELVNSPAVFLWSNNCAYRRNVFLAHPYRASTFNETRGACGRQMVEMQRNGVRTANVASAVVTHPAPNGIRHFVERALAEGRDRVVDFLLADPDMTKLSCLSGVLRIVKGKMRKTLTNCVRERSRLDSTLAEAPILVSVMGCYYSLLVLGALCTLISPDLVEGRWRI
ncbi:MAG: glycosyltransferase family A protein, partial [Verrucomicrobiales bacterium]